MKSVALIFRPTLTLCNFSMKGKAIDNRHLVPSTLPPGKTHYNPHHTTTHNDNDTMSALLEEHMKTRRMLQACDTSQLGPPLPDSILSQFTAAIASDDLNAIHTLLDEHFPDRTEVFPGKYKIQELLPALSQAARHDQADVLEEILVPYPHPFNSFDFIAREAIDTYSKNTLLLLLDHGWDINGRIDSRPTVLETFLHHSHSTPDRDSHERRDMAYWLIDHGAGLNERPRHVDTTGMSHAVEHASVDFVRDLLDHHGGDVQKGQLLHHALRRRHKDDIVEMLHVLLERGAQLNMVMYADDQRFFRNYAPMDLGTPLHDAAQQGNVEAVKYLLTQGADTNVLSSRNRLTALQRAENAGHDDVVAILRSPDQYKL